MATEQRLITYVSVEAGVQVTEVAVRKLLLPLACETHMVKRGGLSATALQRSGMISAERCLSAIEAYYWTRGATLKLPASEKRTWREFLWVLRDGAANDGVFVTRHHAPRPGDPASEEELARLEQTKRIQRRNQCKRSRTWERWNWTAPSKPVEAQAVYAAELETHTGPAQGIGELLDEFECRRCHMVLPARMETKYGSCVCRDC